MNLTQAWRLGRDSVFAWVDDYAPSMGAALAYYTLFSLAPVLIIVIAVAGLVFGADAARGEIVSQLQGIVGSDAATAVQGMLRSASHPAANIVVAVIGVATFLLGAMSTFVELQSDLDRIWRAPVTKTNLGGLLRSRLRAFGMILALGFLLLVSLVISGALAALGRWWSPVFSHWGTILLVVNLVFSLAIETVLFALMYKVLPRTAVAWRDVWIGAVVTAILFTLGKLGIGLYVSKSGLGSAFGAAGSIAVLLVWVYYSAQIFLLGAEFTWVFAHRHGSRVNASPAERSAVPREGVAASPDKVATLARR